MKRSFKYFQILCLISGLCLLILSSCSRAEQNTKDETEILNSVDNSDRKANENGIPTKAKVIAKAISYTPIVSEYGNTVAVYTDVEDEIKKLVNLENGKTIPSSVYDEINKRKENKYNLYVEVSADETKDNYFVYKIFSSEDSVSPDYIAIVNGNNGDIVYETTINDLPGERISYQSPYYIFENKKNQNIHTIVTTEGYILAEDTDLLFTTAGGKTIYSFPFPEFRNYEDDMTVTVYQNANKINEYQLDSRIVTHSANAIKTLNNESLMTFFRGGGGGVITLGIIDMATGEVVIDPSDLPLEYMPDKSHIGSDEFPYVLLPIDQNYGINAKYISLNIETKEYAILPQGIVAETAEQLAANGSGWYINSDTNMYGIVNVDGTIIKEPFLPSRALTNERGYFGFQFRDGVSWFEDENNLFGLISDKGDIIKNGFATRITAFNGGYALIEDDNFQFSIVDINGKQTPLDIPAVSSIFTIQQKGENLNHNVFWASMDEEKGTAAIFNVKGDKIFEDSPILFQNYTENPENQNIELGINITYNFDENGFSTFSDETGLFGIIQVR